MSNSEEYDLSNISVNTDTTESIIETTDINKDEIVITKEYKNVPIQDNNIKFVFKRRKYKMVTPKIKTEHEIKMEKIEEIKKRQQRENILKSIRDKEEYLAFEGKQFIYPNQQDAADKCIEAYKNGAVAVCLIAQPGTGKTGTAQAVMIHMATNPNDEELIYTENIINCTGMSDNDWQEQFKNSVLPAFRDNVFHRQNLIKQKDKLRSLRNALFIPDECHIASGSKMTIAKILKETGILDLNVLQLRNIKMLDISATPDAVLHDYKKWGDKCAIVKIQPGPLYKGFEIMLEEERIINAPKLEDIEDYYELLDFLGERYTNTTKKYFPFRLLDPVKINILENVCDDLDWNYLNHNSDERIDEIDNLMKNPPIKHTIIFIKGFWRASKRISMKHIGATYEPIPKKRDVSVTAQALTARFCDNYQYTGDQLDINLRPLHYCDKLAIEQYVKWFNNDCDFRISEYKSQRISSNGKGKVRSKQTKVNSKIVSGIDEDEADNEVDEPVIDIFNTYEEAKEFYNNTLQERLGGVGPTEREPDENGFYPSTIGRGENRTRVRTFDEIYPYRRWALNENHRFTFYPFYHDINDNTTLQWCLIHK